MTSIALDSVRESAWNKSISLDGEEIVVPKARSVTSGEELVVEGGRVLQKVRSGFCIVNPPFSSQVTLTLGTRELVVSFWEPISEDDWRNVQLLRSFHYRGRAPFGRQGVLLARVENQDDAPEASGLIEIGPAPICNSARDGVLNAPFRDDGIGWEQWDYEARGRYCKLIAEITRVVVHPDTRGIGLGTLLLREAVRYCRTHWQLANHKPVFAEIVAEMLRFHPFPRKAGFHYVGETEGNVRRVAKDLRYMVKKLSKGVNRDWTSESSMERMQWKYARSLVRHVEENGQEMEWALETLRHMDRETLLDHLEVFEDVVRLPKPVYLKGLTQAAQDFLLANVPPADFVATRPHNGPLRQLTAPIILKEVRVDESPPKPETQSTREVCLAFGSLEQLSRRRILEIDCSIPPRSIVLVSGASGSGKTTLLRILSGERAPDFGTLQLPEDFEAGTPQDPRGGIALVDAFDCATTEALGVLGQAGLSEPFLFLQRWDQLSEGQKERARLAMLLKSRANCWLIDSFGARLDTLSTQIVAAKLKSIARTLGITLFVATTRPAEIQDVLTPDVEIRLQAGGCAHIVKAQQSSEDSALTPEP